MSAVLDPLSDLILGHTVITTALLSKSQENWDNSEKAQKYIPLTCQQSVTEAKNEDSKRYFFIMSGKSVLLSTIYT